MTRILTLIGIALITLVVVVGCNGSQAAETPPPPGGMSAGLPADVQALRDGLTTAPQTPAPVEGVADAAVVVTEASLSANGEFVSPAQSAVAPKIPGRVAAVHVDEGAQVRRGQPLFTLETDYLRLDVARAEAEVDRARAALAEAERDFARKEELRGKDSIPQATHDRSRAAFDQARAAHASAEAALRIARQRLADAVVPAPFGGVVAARSVDVGEFLADGGVAYVVIQTAPLKLRFRVPERYLARIRPGQGVSATVDPYPGEEFAGTITTVGGVVDPQTRTLFAEAEFPNADGRLRPGLFARVEARLQ